VFSDLKPYICTMSSCDSELVTFSDRRLWAQHEFNIHRLQRTWSCPKCPHQCKTTTEWTEHLQVQHRSQPPPDLLQIALDTDEVRKELLIEDQVCPFCQTTPSTTRREFVKHVGRHMEDVALAALPMEDYFDNSEATSSTGSDIGCGLEDWQTHKDAAPPLVSPVQQKQQNDRPFKCDHCPSSFMRNHDLKKHKRIHLAVKPFPCEYCMKSFSRKDALEDCDLKL
jgi:uncharacterized Zn-finger protein